MEVSAAFVDIVLKKAQTGGSRETIKKTLAFQVCILSGFDRIHLIFLRGHT
jgi:hypothetical protein